MRLEELKELRDNIPKELLAATFNELYFWTVWGIIRHIADEGVEKNRIKNTLRSYAEWLGKQAAPQLKIAVPNLDNSPESAANLIAFAWVLHDMKATSEKNVVIVARCLHHKNWKKNKLQDLISCNDYCKTLIDQFVEGAIGPGITLTFKQCMSKGDKVCEIHFEKSQ